MPELTPEESRALQSVFRDAAATLPKRVLTGARLEWRSGKMSSYLQMIKASKAAVMSEFDKYQMQNGRNSGIQNQVQGGRARSNAVHGRSAASANSKVGDLRSALMKGTTGTDAYALLREGSAAAAEPMISPMQETAFRSMADMLRDSGLISSAAVDSGVNLATEVAGCLPLVGAITNLSSGVANSLHAIIQQRTIKKVDKLSGIITPGNPRSSVMAVRKLLERKRNDFAYNATLDISAGSLQTAGVFADCGGLTGPAVGLAKAGLKLAHSIARTAQNFAEFRNGNELLTDPSNFTAKDIEACPVLGTFLITEAETSTLLAFLADGDLGPNWMETVEGAKGDIDTLIRIANSCQLIAPYELKGYMRSNGGSSFKGSHMLDFRIHKMPARMQHETKMIMKRDPRNLRFLGKQLLVKLGISVV